MQEAVPLFEYLLRLASAVVLTAALVIVYGGLIQRRLRPRLPWEYAAATLTVVAAWRWVIFLLETGAFESIEAGILDWTRIANQVAFFLIGMSILLLAVADMRRRATDV